MKNQNPQQVPNQDTTASSRGFGVAASPFNGVKMELGIILLLGFILWLAADSITASVVTQLLLLVGYGVAGAAWLIFRTRRVIQDYEKHHLNTNLDDNVESNDDQRLDKE